MYKAFAQISSQLNVVTPLQDRFCYIPFCTGRNKSSNYLVCLPTDIQLWYKHSQESNGTLISNPEFVYVAALLPGLFVCLLIYLFNTEHQDVPGTVLNTGIKLVKMSNIPVLSYLVTIVIVRVAGRQ